jgi:hypothetical protein
MNLFVLFECLPLMMDAVLATIFEGVGAIHQKHE